MAVCCVTHAWSRPLEANSSSSLFSHAQSGVGPSPRPGESPPIRTMSIHDHGAGFGARGSGVTPDSGTGVGPGSSPVPLINSTNQSPLSHDSLSSSMRHRHLHGSFPSPGPLSSYAGASYLASPSMASPSFLGSVGGVESGVVHCLSILLLSPHQSIFLSCSGPFLVPLVGADGSISASGWGKIMSVHVLKFLALRVVILRLCGCMTGCVCVCVCVYVSLVCASMLSCLLCSVTTIRRLTDFVSVC